jgi:hypothetical protein
MNAEKDTLERLAKLEHQQWQSWTEYLVDEFGDELPDELVERWKSNWEPYESLSEEEKDKDRKWARKALEEVAGE